MAMNKATETTKKLKFSNAQPIWQLILLSVCTFNFYHVYWFYRNLKHFKSSHIILRTISLIFLFPIYCQLRRTKVSLKEANIETHFFPSLIAAVYLIIYFISWKLPEPLRILSVTSVLPLAVVQNALNSYWAKEQQELIVRTSLSNKQIALLLIGFIWWILVLTDRPNSLSIGLICVIFGFGVIYYSVPFMRRRWRDIEETGYDDSDVPPIHRETDSEIGKNDEVFDVFLAHNSSDKTQVQAICEELKQRGLEPWLDMEQIPPGRWFQDVIQEAIPKVKSAAIFIGPTGIGHWQTVELDLFLKQCLKNDLTVIPVLLPDVDDFPTDLLFLKRVIHWVKFNGDVYDREALDNLVWGITGKRPQK